MNARDDTLRWLERAVIGLNLCPFAKAVYVKNQVHVAVSEARDAAAVLEDLAREADALIGLPASKRDTTLLVVPHCLHEFLEFDDVVSRAERLLRKRRLEGVIQLASFHPQFQFSDAEPDDIANFTNRSPWPTLHLLREESIDRAVDAFPDAAAIYGNNMEALRRLGRAGWDSLGVGPSP